ncbi:T-cell surface glycoprotein CD3 epsilon chain [Talpa occidentalis]|uniref:T-cell surface glycoprotein CD3 epsilon chain n=1 Tax=Talpa occidentalis TaxID=50954 RepID=UPI00188EA443|nr:T-cell surface glycoprotein CD3 epsilon chain [Talpa occidentalis]
MKSGNHWRVLGLCLLAVGAWVQAENDYGEYEISISGTTVMLTCPFEEDSIKWKLGEIDLKSADKTYKVENFSEVKHSGTYFCHKEKEKNGVYLKARVCENCMEVNVMAVAVIIIVDVCITLGLLFVVYYWSKNRKAKAKPVTRATGTGGRPRGQNKERPPPVPNPDYEPIRKGQRDLYAGLNHRGV